MTSANGASAQSHCVPSAVATPGIIVVDHCVVAFLRRVFSASRWSSTLAAASKLWVCMWSPYVLIVVVEAALAKNLPRVSLWSVMTTPPIVVESPGEWRVPSLGLAVLLSVWDTAAAASSIHGHGLILSML